MHTDVCTDAVCYMQAWLMDGNAVGLRRRPCKLDLLLMYLDMLLLGPTPCQGWPCCVLWLRQNSWGMGLDPRSSDCQFEKPSQSQHTWRCCCWARLHAKPGLAACIGHHKGWCRGGAGGPFKSRRRCTLHTQEPCITPQSTQKTCVMYHPVCSCTASARAADPVE